MADPTLSAETVTKMALAAGWAAAGIAPLRPLVEARDRAHDAIEAGRMAGMSWMTRERIDAAADLGARYPWARSVLSLAWPYLPAVPLAGLRAGEAGEAPAATEGRPLGRMASYACLDAGHGPEDYHDVMARACDQLVASLRESHPDLRAKRFIDHGWAMDRPLAELAGLGFAGKNTTLITPTAGSYVLLAELLLSLDLEPSAPSARNCGTCSACLPACPTGALIEPGVLDARRCISYLTIEHRGSIPVELRPLVGTWVFGCDLCQEACPINQRLAPAPPAAPPGGSGAVPFPDLLDLLQLSEEQFAAEFAGTAVLRTGRAGLARNAAIALGNAGDPTAVPSLRRAAGGDPDPVVRESAEWALETLASSLHE